MAKIDEMTVQMPAIERIRQAETRAEEMEARYDRLTLDVKRLDSKTRQYEEALWRIMNLAGSHPWEHASSCSKHGSGGSIETDCDCWCVDMHLAIERAREVLLRYFPQGPYHSEAAAAIRARGEP